MAYDSANEIIAEALNELGLSSLTGRMWDRYKETGSLEQVFFELRDTSEYRTRFAGMEELRKKGRAISEGAYLEYERQTASVFRQAGLPTGFYDEPGDFARWIGGEVSLRELQERVEVATAAVYQTSPAERAAMESLYGLREGDLVAWALDENRAMPVLQKQFVAARVAGAATRAGYGMLSVNEAELVAQSGNAERAQEVFDRLGAAKEAIVGVGAEDDITREEQIGAASGNTNAARRIEQRLRARRGEYEGSGGYAAGRDGVVGLG